MFKFEIKGDLSGFRSDVRKLREFPFSAAAALNRAAVTVRAAAVKDLARDIGVQQKTVREGISIKKASPSNLETRITVSGKRIPLIDLAARQTKQGVTYRLGYIGRKIAPGAFIAKLKSSHVGVFKRRTKSRLPIDELRGPSLPNVFAKEKLRKPLITLFHERLRIELNQALKFFGSKGSVVDARRR